MHNPRQTMLVAVVRMTENPKRWGWGAALTMPEPFLAFSSSWKKFSNSLPSIYPFPAKIAKKKKKPLTSELESKTDGGQVQWEVGRVAENLSSLVRKQVSGPALDC